MVHGCHSNSVVNKMADIIVEKTLALIKPDAMNWADEIIEEIKRNGFKILQVNLVVNIATIVKILHRREEFNSAPKRQLTFMLNTTGKCSFLVL